MSFRDYICHLRTTVGVSSAPLKRKQVRVYLDEEDHQTLARVVAELPTISESVLMTTILKAGLRCIAANGDRFEMPLEFRFPDTFARELKELKPARGRR